jgi:hypothetical protein
MRLYPTLKLLKIVATNDKTVLPDREKNIALVMYHYPAYIFIVQEISQYCFSQEHSLKVINNIKDIDPVYVWSYNSNFCSLATENTIN